MIGILGCRVSRAIQGLGGSGGRESRAWLLQPGLAMLKPSWGSYGFRV